MKTIQDIVIFEVTTEKSHKALEAEKAITVIVDESATKTQIKKAFFALHGFYPKEVRVLNIKKPVKTKRRTSISKYKTLKKAVVSIPADKNLSSIFAQN